LAAGERWGRVLDQYAFRLNHLIQSKCMKLIAKE
jgi:hypothetical protein